MTTTTTRSKTSSAESTLRRALLANAEFSITTGLVGLIFGGPVADALGVDQVWAIRLLGAGLLGFAFVVFLVSRSASKQLERWSREISLADIGWVVGTVVVILLGWLSTTGAIIMTIVGVVVLGLAIAQHQLRRNMIAQRASN